MKQIEKKTNIINSNKDKTTIIISNEEYRKIKLD